MWRGGGGEGGGDIVQWREKNQWGEGKNRRVRLMRSFRVRNSEMAAEQGEVGFWQGRSK